MTPRDRIPPTYGRSRALPTGNGATTDGLTRGDPAGRPGDRKRQFVETVRRLPYAWRIEDVIVGGLFDRDIQDARDTAKPPDPLCAALQSIVDVDAANALLQSLHLRAFYDHPFKVWDGGRFLSVVLHRFEPEATILDLGSGPHSNVLRWLELFGFRDLYAVDIAFRRPVRRGAIRYAPDNVEHTSFGDARFDCVVSQSVIEHGVRLPSFFREARRLLRHPGTLLVSTDYWPQKVDTRGLRMYGAPWTIFSDEEIQAAVRTAVEAGFEPVGRIELGVTDPLLEVYGCRYTFAFLAFDARL